VLQQHYRTVQQQHGPHPGAKKHGRHATRWVRRAKLLSLYGPTNWATRTVSSSHCHGTPPHAHTHNSTPPVLVTFGPSEPTAVATPTQAAVQFITLTIINNQNKINTAHMFWRTASWTYFGQAGRAINRENMSNMQRTLHNFHFKPTSLRQAARCPAAVCTVPAHWPMPTSVWNSARYERRLQASYAHR